jgi:hypothetical protein
MDDFGMYVILMFTRSCPTENDAVKAVGAKPFESDLVLAIGPR